MSTWIFSWAVSIVISVIKTYGLPALITELQALEVQYPGIASLLQEAILFIQQIQKLGAEAKPSQALIAASLKHKETCTIGCPADIK